MRLTFSRVSHDEHDSDLLTSSLPSSFLGVVVIEEPRQAEQITRKAEGISGRLCDPERQWVATDSMCFFCARFCIAVSGSIK